MPIPVDQLAAASKLLQPICDAVPLHVRDRLEIRYRTDGNSIVVYEWRPSYLDPGNWHEESVAKFVYVASRAVWQLYMMRQDLKWHRYWVPSKFEAMRFSSLLKEVQADPTHIFWG